MSSATDTGNAKDESPTAANKVKYPADEACAYLRSALHYLAKAGVEIGLENGSDDTLIIRLGKIYWYSGKRPGDILLAPTPVDSHGVPPAPNTPPL